MAKSRRPPSEAPFNSIYRHGFVRVAVATPRVEVASPTYNLAQTLVLARQAAAKRAVLAVFPELGLSAYSNEDLFQQDALLDASLAALAGLVDASRALPLVLVAGLPLRAEDRLFNCGVVVHRGRVLGAVPKTYLPNYREFYEKRQFAPAAQALSTSVRLLGQDVPFGSRLLFAATNFPGFVLHLELCEDLWVPLPPSTLATLAGATVVANLSASDITVGKADYRRLLCASQSAKCVAAYLYSAAGPGESTTDLAWDGHALVYENGERLAESQRFPLQPGIVTADIDLDHLRQERTRLTSFGDCAQAHAAALRDFRRVEFELPLPRGRVPLERRVERFPYVPADHDQARRALCRGLRHPGRGADEAAHGHGAQQGGHRDLRRPRLDAGALVAVARVRPARAAAQEHPRLHAARIRHEPPHVRECAWADEGARHRRGTRSTSGRRPS